MTAESPPVDVVIPTHERPVLVRKAIDSVRRQHYLGPLRITVVFDGEPPDEGLESPGPVPVRVLANTRTPGLAGARNCGVVSGSAELVAFLDDDDEWLPGKLERQVARLVAEPAAEFATTAIRVQFEGHTSVRLAGVPTVTHEQLVVSRMAMLHSSTFLIRRDALDAIGMVNESAPASHSEDWDLLLRSSRRGAIAHVDEPLVSVRWGSGSLFAAEWESRIAAAEWILSEHPDVRDSAVGSARLLGQIAFGYAALGRRRAAVASALRASRLHLREPRGYLAMAVASGLVPSASIVKLLHERGHGI
jgi:glycosyltransferase involved in cell wall biosynthesis